MKTIYELSEKGKKAGQIPARLVSAYEFNKRFVSDTSPDLPEVDERTVVGHYTQLSRECFGVNMGEYPLASGESKCIPSSVTVFSEFNGFSALHPSQKKRDIQGCSDLMYRLQRLLGELTGTDAVSLVPASSEQGDYAAIRMISKHFLTKGEFARNKIICLSPDKNYAVADMLCGLHVIKLALGKDGYTDTEGLRKICDDAVAAVVISTPNNYGVFDKNIVEVCNIAHAAGALVYADCSNVNGIAGLFRYGDCGCDLVKVDIGTSFSGAGVCYGMQASPICVKAELAQYLPSPVVTKDKSNTYSLLEPEKTIGKVQSYFGNFKLYAALFEYLMIVGRDGLRTCSEMAVLNANYLKKLLEKYDDNAGKKCMQSFALPTAKLRKKYSISAADIVKQFEKHGIYPPKTVDDNTSSEALIFEPGENESKQSLDEFARVFDEIIENLK